jgi:hypothetical protein
MTVGMNIVEISSEYYTLWIFSNVLNSCEQDSHFRHSSILNQWDILSRKIMQTDSNMITGDGLQDMQDLLPARAKVVPLICGSDKTHLTNYLGYKHDLLLYWTIRHIRIDISRTSY